ncbi:MAG: NAD(P)H-hydrate dehydratase [Chroococcus sp. CMT-3BRIN-NPC107]|jgi:NAD(P)H-hydrate epimerase|nr:NAD(P)H-hydrate dehydratase [Chroococcus sp. CMT-3BRIN-NPC107]
MDIQRKIDQFVVSAQQMRDIEGRIFAAGMPVAALMEKVGLNIALKLTEIFPNQRIGVLVGSGHNGGDALVVARELHFYGYKVAVYSPFSQHKELTHSHAQYAESLGIERCNTIENLLNQSDILIDGLFGFGLERDITDDIAKAIAQVNQSSLPVISIDLPSGLHTDTGEVLGIAIKATHTFCLGLWKLGLLQDNALDYVGKAELIDFDIPLTDIYAVLGETPKIERISTELAIARLPLHRPAVTHKYKQGHLLLICGSVRYAGGAILTGLGARASGVGMLSIAVPESLKPLLVAQLPEALIIGCPETELGAIAQLKLSAKTNLDAFDAISCGPGLTSEATPIIEEVLDCNCPLILDADGLNVLAELGTIPTLAKRQGKTILTPHTGEFKRLFPDLGDLNSMEAVTCAAKTSGAVVLLKGARTKVASPDGLVWINPESTPALARGGSGDVLTGLMGGLVAQKSASSLAEITSVAAWWHSQAGIKAARIRTEMGVDAFTLTHYLLAVLSELKI